MLEDSYRHMKQIASAKTSGMVCHVDWNTVYWHTQQQMHLGQGEFMLDYGFIQERAEAVDLSMVGREPCVFMVRLETGIRAFRRAVYALARWESYTLVPKNLDIHPEIDKLPKIIENDDDLEEFHRLMDFDPERTEFDGRTRGDWCLAREREIVAARDMDVAEGWKLREVEPDPYLCESCTKVLPELVSPIKLDAVVDVPYITLDVVSDFVRQFLEDPLPFWFESPVWFSQEELDAHLHEYCEWLHASLPPKERMNEDSEEVDGGA